MRLIKGGIVIVSFSEVMKLMMHVNGLSDMSVLKTVVGSLPRLRTSPPGHLPPRTFPPTSLSRTFPPPGLFPPHGKHFSNYRSHCASHYIVDRYDERPSRIIFVKSNGYQFTATLKKFAIYIQFP